MENVETILGVDAQAVIAVVLAWSGRLVAAIVIMLVGRWVAARFVGAVRRAMARAGIETTLARFLSSVINIVLLVIVALTALGTAGIPTTNFLAVLGAAGLGVGLALKDSLSNFSAGIMLVFFKPFRVGDFVEAASVSGFVNSIGIFSTVIRTPDNRIITVPNGLIYGAIITNYSAEPTRRIDLVIGISYADSVAEARRIIGEVLAADGRVLTDPAPDLLLMELGESSVNLAVRPWVNREDYWEARSDLLENIKRALEAQGLSIPFPQRDLHIVSQAAASH